MALATTIEGDGILTAQDNAVRIYNFVTMSGVISFKETRTSETRLWTALTQAAVEAGAADVGNNERARVIEENRHTGPPSYGLEVTTETTTIEVVVPE